MVMELMDSWAYPSTLASLCYLISYYLSLDKGHAETSSEGRPFHPFHPFIPKRPEGNQSHCTDLFLIVTASSFTTSNYSCRS